MLYELSSCSFAFHEIGCITSCTPSLLHTSFATSISNPTISLFSSLYPIGGKLSSSPKMKVFLFKILLKEFPVSFVFILVTKTTATIAIIIIAKIKINLFFI